jgi:hypothetical protein
MVIDEYNSSSDIWIRFPQGHLVHAAYQQFLNGNVKNIYDQSVFGIGFIGEGKYKLEESKQQYKSWVSMLARCYSEKFHEKQPTYIGCTVCEEWHNFQNYAKWYDENYYEVDGYKMNLDKDILVKGNKIYSPETCVFVPDFINLLFVNRKQYRGSLPVGVKVCTKNPKKYEAQCRNNTGKRIYLGYYDSPEEAFQYYKEFKENLIKETAKEYEDRIPHTLFNAMCNYVVEISD